MQTGWIWSGVGDQAVAKCRLGVDGELSLFAGSARPRQDNDGVQRVFLNSADPGLDPCKKQAERERQAAGNNSCSCANNILTSNRIKGLFQPDQSWWLLAQCKN